MATTTRHFVQVIEEARNTKETFAGLIAKANRLNLTQRQWLLKIYHNLEDLERKLYEWRDHSRNGIQGYHTLSGEAQRLLYLVDKAYSRVIDPDAEAIFMYCDGEPPHACSEAMFRLRVLVLCYTW